MYRNRILLIKPEKKFLNFACQTVLVALRLISSKDLKRKLCILSVSFPPLKIFIGNSLFGVSELKTRKTTFLLRWCYNVQVWKQSKFFSRIPVQLHHSEAKHTSRRLKPSWKRQHNTSTAADSFKYKCISECTRWYFWLECENTC